MKHFLWAAASVALVATVVELVGPLLAAAAALFIGTVALGLKGELVDRRTPTTNEPGPDGDHDGWVGHEHALTVLSQDVQQARRERAQALTDGFVGEAVTLIEEGRAL